MKSLLQVFAVSLAMPLSLVAGDESDDRINEHSTMLIQAIMKLPESMIGGVSLDDRGDFLTLISHYGDIDFAKGFFKLRGDGARAHDQPVSRGFQIKLFDRSEGRPLCILTQFPGDHPPISIISFGQYWRWEDVTRQHLPENLSLNRQRVYEPSPDNNEITVFEIETIVGRVNTYSRRGPKIGKLAWKDDQFTFVEEK